jgi:hypothetical protein
VARPDPPRGASAEDKERMAQILADERGATPQASFGAVDERTAPLPKRAMRTDDLGRPGREKFEANRPAPEANGTTSVPKPDATLKSAIAPQLGLDLGDAGQQVRKANPGLADKFLVPPFTVLDTRAGYWQERRRAWLSLGFRGETGPSAAVQPEGLGRAQGLIYQHDAPASDPGFYDKKRKTEEALGCTLTTEEFKRDHYKREDQEFGQSQSVATGTSVFDPVLCEIVYRWFTGDGAQVLDPFAGGVVRGALAAALGLRYVGVELRPEQIADNRAQAAALFGGEGALDFGREVEPPRWVEGDATRMHEHDLPFADLVFTCPPYGSLEQYSDDPRDLSTMGVEEFREAMARVLADSAAMLRPDRFAVWVVGEYRTKQGVEAGFVSDMVVGARAAGLDLYNSAVLINSVGSAALRAQRIIRSRKRTRVHQHVLVFCKGDPKRAAAACGRAEVDV